MITPVQAWTEEFMPKPDAIHQATNFGSSNYAAQSGISAYGTQATFDLFTRGRTDRGLRVTIARSSLAGPASDGVLVQVTRVNADALSADYDGSAKTFNINVQDATTMANLKTEVDAETGISSVYFGGETGTGLAESNIPVSAGGADGAQGTFDILGDGQTSQGLRVTLGRASGRFGADSNGYRVTFAAGTGTVSINDATRMIPITFPDDTALSFLKTIIDAVAGLSSVYFGGETGASTIADADTLDDTATANGTPDVESVVDIPARTGGEFLRVYIRERTTLSGTAANGVHVPLTRNDVDGGPTVAFSIADKQITGDLLDSTRVRDLIPFIGAIAGLRAESFGGGGGGELAEATGAISDGGGEDPHAWVRVHADASIFVATGTSAPSDDSGSVLVRVTHEWRGTLNPGESLYARRVGSNNVRGSAEMWLHTV